MSNSSRSLVFWAALLFLCFCVCPSNAFGAGNIASTARIEGHNFRHGDIEDTLLTLLLSRAAGGKKFTKMAVAHSYFGNWMRDYSQAVDVGTVKMVSSEAIRILLWVLGFLSFGYGTKEFEVTSERLGCYRPEEHIDNPKDYADNVDARQYDRRLRGPVDEERELSVDHRTGLKNYIASEGLGITTSAGFVRETYGRSIYFGRRYAHTKNHADLYEALRLLGTANHTLEDYSAHSNYTELALIELGERDIFPHVGRRTQLNIPGARHAVWPIVTGTFGGVDFLHSVMGEFSDKATQSEIQELEGTLQNSQQNSNSSLLQELLDKLPSGIFGGKDQAGKVNELQANSQAAQMQNMHITPREPEEWTKQLNNISKQIYPILEFHDDILKSIAEFIEKIPILPDLIEQLQDQINMFVFSLLAPFILPIINQVKAELSTGSSEVIQSSREKQLIVFNDDHSTDPTHSMLSKDHFSNILNEPAGKVACQVLKWAVPQVIACWDDERIDVERTMNRIVHGVFHHPALRDYGDDGARDGRQLMFSVVQQWWGEKNDEERDILRDQLSRDGVQTGRNHKEGVEDCGHGCGKPLGMPNAMSFGNNAGSNHGGGGGVLGQVQQALGQEGGGNGNHNGNSMGGLGKLAGDAVGGGALGGLVGGLVGSAGANLLGSAFKGRENKTQIFENEGYGEDNSYQQSYTQTSHHPQSYAGDEERYGQAQYTQSAYPDGGRRQDYQRYEQFGRQGDTGYGYEERVDTRPSYGGGYEERVETRYERPAQQWESEVRREDRRQDEDFSFAEGSRYESNSGNDQERYGSGDDGRESHHKHKHHHHHKKHHGSDNDSDNESRQRYHGNRYGEENVGYGEPSGFSEEPRFQERPAYDGYESRSGRQEYGGEFGGGRREYGNEYERFEEPSGFERRFEEPPAFEAREGFGSRGYDEGGFEGRGYAGREALERGEEYGDDRGYGVPEEFGERRRYGDEY
ncbi:Het-C-domain-containing protein [Xylona heveae TC161]|uniref:Het-C-domain-containing protein n=1 Tax=Xylona heveae (strain CBS 132557 / TC161) TaxID=1328760 RepID=A0A165GB27_XYLHT|nr:Het-C-domain-containing protein [Xylona heveae TC161]KZF21970.1 Het-C-domain-containing protein [Xylona heveae TC161]